MRRIVITLATLSLLGAGLFHAAVAQPQSTPADAVTAGTATIVTGIDPAGPIGTWTTTLSGQIAAGGRVFSGTASGTAFEDGPSPLWFVSFSGTSASGSITGGCSGTDQPDPSPFLGSTVPSAPAPAGVLVMDCGVSIDGTASVPLKLVIALAPTTDPTTYKGVFTGVGPPGLDSLPTIPAVSFGYSYLTTFAGPFNSDADFGFTGQITLGGQAYHGSASGQATSFASATPFVALVTGVDPFPLSGTSPTGSLSATCSGQFVTLHDTAIVTLTGLALSVLGCDGSVNGGPQGHTTLVSVYRVTGDEIHFGETVTYDGLFVGI